MIDPQEKILGKERDCRLKAKEITAALSCQAKSSMDQKNIETYYLKVKLK